LKYNFKLISPTLVLTVEWDVKLYSRAHLTSADHVVL